jgi:hypothetical protein
MVRSDAGNSLTVHLRDVDRDPSRRIPDDLEGERAVRGC